MHNSASDDSSSKTNVRPSFDDNIRASARTDSASSVAVRAFFHSSLKSTAISFTGQGDGDETTWGLGCGCLACLP